MHIRGGGEEGISAREVSFFEVSGVDPIDLRTATSAPWRDDKMDFRRQGLLVMEVDPDRGTLLFLIMVFPV